MKAIVFDKGLKYVEDYPMPEPGQGEARVRVRMAGICNTDLEIMEGYKGFTGALGHEFVGVVESADGQNKRLLGQRVVGEINCVCGACDLCRNGMHTHCRNRTVLGISGKDGAFAEYLTLPAANLWVVPAQLPDEAAVFAEPLAAAFEVVERAHVAPSKRVLVLGDGKLGLLCAFVINLSGAEVHIAGKHGDKLHLAAVQGMGTILAGDLLPEKDYDVVVEATGSADGFRLALECVRPRGTIIMKSTLARPWQIDLNPLVVDEVSVIGSRCGPFGPALRTMAKGFIPILRLVTATYGPQDFKTAFEKARDSNSLKVLFDFR
jgi:alcohol dehydrogenase